jgi:hypothetical protein
VVNDCQRHQSIENWLTDEQTMRRKEHDALLEKIDKIIACQATHYGEVKELKGIVTNGLRATTEKTAQEVAAISKQLEVIQEKYDGKINEIDEFKWFRDWINDVRNHLFKYIVVFGLLGGGLWMIISYGKELIKGIIKG